MPAKLGHSTSQQTRLKIAVSSLEHGHSKAPKGSPELRTYRSWTGMRRRCMQPTDNAFSKYGGRGIFMDPEWWEYPNFLSDMGLQPYGMSIDRIDNDQGYAKSNCRWATKQTQARNRRSNHLLTIDGTTMTLAEWSDKTGLKSATIRMRIKYNGELVDRSIIAPILKK